MFPYVPPQVHTPREIETQTKIIDNNFTDTNFTKLVKKTPSLILKYPQNKQYLIILTMATSHQTMKLSLKMSQMKRM